MNTFSTDTGAVSQSACTQCPEGKSSSSNAAISENACQMFYVQIVEVLDGISTCESGTEVVTDTVTCERYKNQLITNGQLTENVEFNNDDTDTCTYVDSGNSDTTDGIICYKPCPAGWYTDVQGTQCTQCGIGRYSSTSGETSETACTACALGKYPGADLAQTTCKNCPRGYAMNRDAIDTGGVCDACEIGEFTDQEGKTTCESCPEGKTSDTSATDDGAKCSICLPGRYRDTGPTGACKICSEGTYR